MGPMSDVTMMRRLCGADLGHAMSWWHCCWPKAAEPSLAVNVFVETLR
jgi:hypothetical protein